ncbi:hypothetical protein H0W80_05090 [Candidatus Saccharibacteria bacterium]|nr:hypothetical protein [Candidatus Saccharibacteria bacterium]
MTKGRKPGPKKASRPQVKRKKPESNLEFVEKKLAKASKSTRDVLAKKYVDLKKTLESLKKMVVKLADEHMSTNFAAKKKSTAKKTRRTPAKAAVKSKAKTKTKVTVKAKPKAKAETKVKVTVKAKPKAKAKAKVAKSKSKSKM